MYLQTKRHTFTISRHLREWKSRGYPTRMGQIGLFSQLLGWKLKYKRDGNVMQCNNDKFRGAYAALAASRALCEK